MQRSVFAVNEYECNENITIYTARISGYRIG